MPKPLPPVAPYPVPDITVETLLLESARRFQRAWGDVRRPLDDGFSTDPERWGGENWVEPLQRAIAHLKQVPVEDGQVEAWARWAAVWLYAAEHALPLALGLTRADFDAWALHVFQVRPARRRTKPAVGRGDPTYFDVMLAEDSDADPWETRAASGWRDMVREQWAAHRQALGVPQTQAEGHGQASDEAPLERLEAALAGRLNGASLRADVRRAWAAAAIENERLAVADRWAHDLLCLREAIAHASPPQFCWPDLPAWNSLRDQAQTANPPPEVWELLWLTRVAAGSGPAALVWMRERLRVRGFHQPHPRARVQTWLPLAEKQAVFDALVAVADPLDPARPWLERLEVFASMGPAVYAWNPLFVQPWLLPHMWRRARALPAAEQAQVRDVWACQLLSGLQHADPRVNRSPPRLSMSLSDLEAWWRTGQLSPTAARPESLPSALPRWYLGDGRWTSFHVGLSLARLGCDGSTESSFVLDGLFDHPDAAAVAAAADGWAVPGVPDAVWGWLLAVSKADPLMLNHMNFPLPEAGGAQALASALDAGCRLFAHSQSAFHCAALTLFRRTLERRPPVPLSFAPLLAPLWSAVARFLAQSTTSGCTAAFLFQWWVEQPLPTDPEEASAESEALLALLYIEAGKASSHPEESLTREFFSAVVKRLQWLWMEGAVGGPRDPSPRAQKRLQDLRQTVPALNAAAAAVELAEQLSPSVKAFQAARL